MEEEKDALELFLDWLLALPENFEIVWFDNHSSMERPFCSGWIDVQIAEVEQLCKLNWVWTIIDENDSDIEDNPEILADPWTIILPYDLDIHSMWNPEDFQYEHEIASPKNTMNEYDYRFMFCHIVNHSWTYNKRGGWSPEFVSSKLSGWVKDYTGRTDVQFRWTGEGLGPLAQGALEQVEKMQSGEQNSYQLSELGNGFKLKASDEVMDVLLHNPELGKSVVEAFQNMFSGEDDAD
jgi:hypothetical protein